MSILSRLEAAKRRVLGEDTDQDSSRESIGSDVIGALPTLLGTSLLAATIVLVFLHFTSFGMPKTVTFDIIKYVNAQRAIASKFMGANANTEEATTELMSVSKNTRKAINDAAGPNTMVVISQSVISGNTRDITDEVLTKLGLPTNVPSTDPTRRAIDLAPTILGNGPRYLPGAPLATDPKTPTASTLP